MVDIIVEAAARVFTETGFDRATTNAIAELAGVSVGSLYQYFPDKLAVLEAVHQRHIIGLWARAGVACQQGCTLPWPEALRHFVGATVNYNVASGRLFGIFQKELPASFPTGPQFDTAKLNYEADLRAFLNAHRSKIHVDLERAVHMIPILGKGIVTTAFHLRPDDLVNGRLIEEVTDVFTKYLTAIGSVDPAIGVPPTQ